MTLNACTVSEQKKPSATVPQASNSSDDLAHLAPVIMLQPEKSIRIGINDPDISGPQLLLGLSADDVHKMLGVPDFKHLNASVEIWQYRKESCLLDVFLYFENDRPDNLRVRHAEARSRSVTTISQNKCFFEAMRVKH
jgi:hypothetical protein